tara:strand:- start:665 stop:1165 length:501 start_codon:yes stop_codon:yes gene_type:complete
MIDSSGYRKNVGIILVNSSSELLICKRYKEQSWQFPQGGFKKNETAESAMYRELYEEVGLKKNDVLIIGRTKEWLKYELPKKYQRKTNNQLCVGQKQIWFLLKLASDEAFINLNVSKKPEFDGWRWVSKQEPLDLVINFKKNVYEMAINELMPLLDLSERQKYKNA